MSLVLHRIPGIGSPRGFIRFSRCQFLHLPVRSGFERVFAHGLARAAIERPNSLGLLRLVACNRKAPLFRGVPSSLVDK